MIWIEAQQRYMERFDAAMRATFNMDWSGTIYEVKNGRHLIQWRVHDISGYGSFSVSTEELNDPGNPWHEAVNIRESLAFIDELDTANGS